MPWLKLTAAREEITVASLSELIAKDADSNDATLSAGATEALARLRQAGGEGGGVVFAGTLPSFRGFAEQRARNPGTDVAGPRALRRQGSTLRGHRFRVPGSQLCCAPE